MVFLFVRMIGSFSRIEKALWKSELRDGESMKEESLCPRAAAS